MQTLRTRAMTLEQAGAILATLYISVHKTPPPPALLSLRDWFAAVSRHSGDRLPAHIAAGILTLIERLAPGDGLCHGDLHPGNVIMTADGPKIIDWVASFRAGAALDLGRCHLLLSELPYAPEGTDPGRPRALNAAVQSEYARMASLSEAALRAAMQPYLPILYAVVIADWATNPARRAQLIQRVEATLRSQG
jgi:Ser/Thr protein kinase RdoA (MazF antagonist)